LLLSVLLWNRYAPARRDEELAVVVVVVVVVELRIGTAILLSLRRQRRWRCGRVLGTLVEISQHFAIVGLSVRVVGLNVIVGGRERLLEDVFRSVGERIGDGVGICSPPGRGGSA